MWKVEINKMLELHKQRIIEEIVKNYKNRNLYKVWSESFEVKSKKLKFEENKLYIDWYNDAVKEINERVKSFSEYLEKTLQNII